MTDEMDDKQQPDPATPEPEVPSEDGGGDSAADQVATPDGGGDSAADQVATPDGGGDSAADRKVIPDDGGGDAVAVENEQPSEQSSEQSAGDAPAGDESAPGEDLKTVNTGDASEDDAEAAMLSMLEDLPSDSGAAEVEDIDFGSSAAKAEFQQLSEPAGRTDARNIDMLMDVNLPVSIELGRTKMSISDILALGPGSVVELAKLAGEPVDVMVNYKIVARGEVVVIDENFGVRITQLMTPEERLKALGEEQ